MENNCEEEFCCIICQNNENNIKKIPIIKNCKCSYYICNGCAIDYMKKYKYCVICKNEINRKKTFEILINNKYFGFFENYFLKKYLVCYLINALYFLNFDYAESTELIQKIFTDYIHMLYGIDESYLDDI
jgi:hypothetical protein